MVINTENYNKLVINNLSIKIQSKDNPDICPVVDLNLVINQGETVALLGESGSGKSMTANAVLQTLPSNAFFTKESSIVFHHTQLLDKSEYEMRRLRGSEIAMIFQDPMSALNPVFTIGNQILEVLKLKNKNLSAQQKTSQQDYYKTIVELLSEVGLQEPDRVYKSYPHQLSGGMRQRVVIAMALAGEPKLLLADEPTTALDVTIAQQILELLKKLQTKYSMAMLFITHNIAIVSSIADKVAVMHKGKIVEFASTQELLKSPKHAYTKMLLGSQLVSIKTSNPEPQRSKSVLTVSDLQVTYKVNKKLIRAVDYVSFELPELSTLALVGESGSGKTSIAKALVGLVKSTGKINHNGHLVQIIFQDPYSSLNPRMVISEIINEGYQARYRQKLSKAKIVRLVNSVGLPDEAIYKYPHEFSGGERQRIAIARALAVKPKILILDEPTSALDVSIQAQILKLLEDLQRDYQMSYLLISHDFAVVAHMADLVAVMYHGKIIEYGLTQQVLTKPKHEYTKILLSAVPHLK